MKFCTKCGTQLADEAQFCTYCGAQQRKIDEYIETHRASNAPQTFESPKTSAQINQKSSSIFSKVSKKTMFLTMSIIMIVFFGFVNAVTVSAQIFGVSGDLKSGGVLDYMVGDGDFAFSRFVGFLMLLLPIAILVKQLYPKYFVRFKFNVEKTCFITGIILFVIFIGSLPSFSEGFASAEIKPAFGTLLYLICDIVGLVYLHKVPEEKSLENEELPVVGN